MICHDDGDHVISLPFLQKVVTTLYIGTHLKTKTFCVEKYKANVTEAESINQKFDIISV